MQFNCSEKIASNNVEIILRGANFKSVCAPVEREQTKIILVKTERKRLQWKKSDSDVIGLALIFGIVGLYQASFFVAAHVFDFFFASNIEMCFNGTIFKLNNRQFLW